jgi:hypothetical protein
MLLLAVVGTQVINIGKAFPPYQSDLESSITIFVSSPENNKLYNTDAVKLNFNVTVGETTDNSLISKVCYKTDWQEENSTIFSFDGYFLRELMYQLLSHRKTLINPISKFSTTLNITGVPDGNHSITIYASMWYYSSMERRLDVFEEYFDYNDLTMANIGTTVSFAIDTTPPIISILSTKDKYDTSDVPLNFTVNELVSQITYSLDGQDKVTIPENATLIELRNGDHNVTVYATDWAGNTGASETMYFSVEIPFPAILVITPIATVTVAGIGLIVYFKKRKR